MTDVEKIVTRATGIWGDADSDAVLSTDHSNIAFTLSKIETSDPCGVCGVNKTTHILWPSDCDHSVCTECATDRMQSLWASMPRVSVSWNIDVDAPFDRHAFLNRVVDSITRETKRTKIDLFLKHHCSCPICDAKMSMDTQVTCEHNRIELVPATESPVPKRRSKRRSA